MASKKNGPTDIGAGIAGIRADLKKQGDALREVAAAIRAEIAQVNDRFDRLERRQIDSDVRVATEFAANAGANTILIDAIKALGAALGADLREAKGMVSDIRDDRARMTALEERIARLERAS